MKYISLKKANGIDKNELKEEMCGNCKNYLWDSSGDRHDGSCKLKDFNLDFTIGAAPLGRLHALTGCSGCYYFNIMSIIDNNNEANEVKI